MHACELLRPSIGDVVPLEEQPADLGPVGTESDASSVWPSADGQCRPVAPQLHSPSLRWEWLGISYTSECGCVWRDSLQHPTRRMHPRSKARLPQAPWRALCGPLPRGHYHVSASCAGRCVSAQQGAQLVHMLVAQHAVAQVDVARRSLAGSTDQAEAIARIVSNRCDRRGAQHTETAHRLLQGSCRVKGDKRSHLRAV